MDCTVRLGMPMKKFIEQHLEKFTYEIEEYFHYMHHLLHSKDEDMVFSSVRISIQSLC